MKFKESITWREIQQQPLIWREEIEILKNHRERLEGFLQKVSKENRRIIFIGAGSSEFVGNTISPYLKKKLGIEVLSIPTTDIVSMPDLYLDEKEGSIFVSCARSGNSPESVAAVELVDQVIEDALHIFVTCNPEGKLAKMAEKSDNKYLLLMPEKTNDKGFAMTGSFSSMLMAGMIFLDQNTFDSNMKQLQSTAELMEENFDKMLPFVEKIAALEMERIIYLGDGILKGLAEEVSLKVLELTSGKIVSLHNTFLGFRHGPKSVVNDKTVIVCMMSADSLTREYELDLLKEFKKEGGKKKIVVLDSQYQEEIEKNCDYYFSMLNEKVEEQEDSFSALFYLLFGQLLSLVKSVNFGIQPDNPCPTGEVNRVVKGVRIYSFLKEKR